MEEVVFGALDHTAYVVDLSGGIRGHWSANAPMTEEPLTMLSRCAVVHADGVSRLVSLLTGRELNESPALPVCHAVTTVV